MSLEKRGQEMYLLICYSPTFKSSSGVGNQLLHCDWYDFTTQLKRAFPLKKHRNKIKSNVEFPLLDGKY